MLGYGLSVSVNEISVLPVLDHSIISFEILIPNSLILGKETRTIRSSRYISTRALHDLAMGLPDVVDLVFNQAPSVDLLTANFNNVLRGLLDSVAPIKTRKCLIKNHNPWLNDDLQILRKNCRKIERQ